MSELTQKLHGAITGLHSVLNELAHKLEDQEKNLEPPNPDPRPQPPFEGWHGIVWKCTSLCGNRIYVKDNSFGLFELKKCVEYLEADAAWLQRQKEAKP